MSSALFGLAALLPRPAVALPTELQPAHLVTAAVTSAADSPDEICEVGVGKTASPSQVELGQAVRISLEVHAVCPGGTAGAGADIVLAIDRSSSQRDNGTWLPTVSAAIGFVDLIDFSRNQVGVVAFESSAQLSQPLTADADAVRNAIQAIPEPPAIGFSTNITSAVEAAQQELTGPRHRPDVQPVLILLSDGAHNALLAGSPISAATLAKQAGTLIITIGLGVSGQATATLRSMASREDLYFPAPTASDLVAVYAEVAGAVGGPATITELRVVDLLTSEVAYVAGSAQPEPSRIQGDTLFWDIATLPSGGWQASYLVRPLVTGRIATNKLAFVDYLDADGSAASRVFPEPYINVRAPGEQIRVFAPLAYKGYCKPGLPFDVVLALDSSRSMDGEKFDRMIEAARAFLGYLDLPPSQAALIAFNSLATTVEDLSTDRSRLLTALDQLPRAEGTRIDFALQEAVAIFSNPALDPQRERVIILITDGRQQGGNNQEVINAAAAARRVGARIYTISVGEDVDPTLLIRVAGDPARYFPAPSADDLRRIYVDIAGALPCGTG
jgi:Mg-chelatase subunit ChlD